VVRVLVCDESALLRRAMVLALEAEGDVEVVAEGPDADAARAAALQHAPDVAVLSADLPPYGGDRTTLALRETNPGLQVVVVYDPDEAVRTGHEVTRSLRAGAQALVPRVAAVERVVDVVHTLGRGRPLVEPVLARGLLAEYSARQEPVLTTRERAVLERITAGATVDEAAGAIEASPHTAVNLVANALVKLQRAARAEMQARQRQARSGER